MDSVQTALFGSFPRRVGTPNQFWVFNESQFDVFTDTVDGVRNAYATVSRLPLNGQPVSDKVLFDLDGDKSVFPDDAATDERVHLMRQDPDLAAEVLGPVCDEAQRLTRASHDDGIPVVGVFSGFGLHIHQLYQATVEPQVAMTTCAARYIDQCGLDTADWKVVGDTQRICRVPNVERATFRSGPRQQVLDGRATGLWTIPLTGEELRDVTPQWLLERSEAPRTPEPLYSQDRPQMPVWEDYRDKTGVGGETETTQRPVDQRTAPLSDEGIEVLLREMLQMPCMYERIVQPNPEHPVRVNCAVLLFNVGLNPQQVENLYSRLGWVDYDPQVTRKHLEHIYRSGYSDMTCQSIREKGLCTRAENPRDCPCYGWSGGSVEWKQ